MPTEDLRKSLAKAKVEAEREKQRFENMKRLVEEHENASPLRNPQVWKDAREAWASGWRKPEPRFYVVVSPPSPVSTPEKLQEVANMTSAPKLFDTTYTGLHGDDPNAAQMQEDGKPQTVRVGEVSWEELKEVKRKTEYTKFVFVWINGKVRGATMVKWFKTDEHEGGQEDGATIREGNPGASPCEVQMRSAIWEGWD